MVEDLLADLVLALTCLLTLQSTKLIQINAFIGDFIRVEIAETKVQFFSHDPEYPEHKDQI